MTQRILTFVQNGTQPDHGGALVCGHAVVLARSHRKLAEAVALGELTEAPEERARSLRVAGFGRHRHQPAHVVVEAKERLQLALGDPRLRVLAGEVDLDERGNLEPPRGRLARERVAELAEVVDGPCRPAGFAARSPGGGVGPPKTRPAKRARERAGNLFRPPGGAGARPRARPPPRPRRRVGPPPLRRSPPEAPASPRAGRRAPAGRR